MPHTPKSSPVVLAIGGSDSSAGAGIQADLKAIHAGGGYGLTVVTGVVAESPLEVVSWEAMSPRLVVEQLECVLRAYPVSALKVGLLFNPEIVLAVAETLSAHPEIPIVVDPVGSASAGAEFGGEELRKALQETLFPQATLVTPNIPEARLFLGGEEKVSTETLAEEFGKTFQTQVLVKGGHEEGGEVATDILWTPDATHHFSLPWISGSSYHGTGCTLSSSIATELAHDHSLPEAVKQAKFILHNAMKNGYVWQDQGTRALRLP